MQITLVYSPGPRKVHELSLDLPLGSTAELAFAAAVQVAPQDFKALDLASVSWSVWGRNVAPDQVLVDGDRLALCRALKVDPKTARRERFAQQGSRATGLFAKKKRGVEAGY